MFRKMIGVVVPIVIGASLIGTCSAQEQPRKPDRIDAHTLLTELGDMVKETPNTKEGCQAVIEQIRVWQERKSRELKGQYVSPKYGFEYQWVPQDYSDSQACTRVVFSDERHVDGTCSLKMMMDLVGGDKHKGKGEAWVDMLQNPPYGEHIPIDLTGRTVTAWIYAPWGARGASNKPNGFQIFVKDTNGKSEYGPWQNAREAEWFKISLNVSPYTPKSGHMDSGFDPSRIVVVGVKMAAGDGSKERYNGPVFVDGVDW